MCLIVAKEKINDIKNSDLESVIQKKLDSDNKKILKYASDLYFEILNNVELILDSIKHNKINDIKRYYLKPLLEDIVTLTNLKYYRKDYKRAIDIQFLGETIQALRYFDVIYKKVGANLKKLDEVEIRKKQEKKYHKITNDLVFNLMTDRNNDIHFNPKFYEKLNLYEKTSQENTLLLRRNFIEGLYDYVNNYSHLNLYFINKVKEKPYKFEDLLCNFINEILTNSTRHICEIYKIEDDEIKELYLDIHEYFDELNFITDIDFIYS